MTVWVYILNIVKKSPTSPAAAIFSIYVLYYQVISIDFSRMLLHALKVSEYWT